MNRRIYIGTTRFNNSTFKENEAWRIKNNWKGCIYGLNKKIPPHIPKNAIVYVIEMNNDTNRVEGIGLIRNFINYAYNIRIYKHNTEYNRYVYNSDYRLSNDNIKYKKSLLLLEKILFYGSRHYKRGHGISFINTSTINPKINKLLKRFLRKLFVY
jgi:hypothetical protein